MKQTSLFFVFFCWGLGAWGQKQDYTWLQGYDSFAGYDTTWHHWFGTSVLDFNYSPRESRLDSLKMNFSKTNTSYSDSNGNLLFYTNGIYIANALDEKIENSDSLNWGPFIPQFDPSIFKGGYRSPQGIIALQNPGIYNQYYLIHDYIDTSATLVIYVKRILTTLLDKNLNLGHGSVVYKNQTLLEDNLGSNISACRHANGRDWWLLVQKRNSNCYYRVLLDPTGPHEISPLICGGDSVLPEATTQSCFSSDGSKYVNFSVYTGVSIFDFDRCTGQLYNPVFLPIPALVDSGWYSQGVAISPNNRFLYIGATTLVYQYDLQASNIDSTRAIVAKYDGFQSPFGSYFHTMQLAPDGKIYESCGNAEDVYHVIERPDEKGDSCLFLQHAIHLPTWSWGVPNFPNYRLGALVGSPCDTITGLNETARAEKEKILKVFPNPATDVVTVDYGFTDWNKGAVRLEIINELGQVVHEQSLTMYSGFQRIEVGGFAAGVYQVMVKRGNGVVGVSKFRKE